jgi:septal ring factor EnvC (AmiA/AmiB activator)
MAEASQTRAMLEQLQDELARQVQKTADLETQMADVLQALAPAAEEAAPVAVNEPKSNGPIVGFPEVPGFKD